MVWASRREDLSPTSSFRHILQLAPFMFTPSPPSPTPGPRDPMVPIGNDMVTPKICKQKKGMARIQSLDRWLKIFGQCRTRGQS